MATTPSSQFDYYVSLDLGSETMSAYYEHAKNGTNAGKIDLQAHARALLGTAADPDFLLEDDGSISSRLRTRVALMDNRQPDPLPDSHALLDFVDQQGVKLPGYDQSLFVYFFNKNQAKAFDFMPNPKVPFQEGGQDIIPKVVPSGTPSGTKVDFPAETLLQHMTTQVVRNFILKSPQLRNVRASRIHLTLTIPNVYSLTHAESIRAFLLQHAGVHDVNVLYESDAVAYFLNGDDKPTDTVAITQLKRRMLNRREEKLRIATIDIGRGTTDLSLIQVAKPVKQGAERRHYVLARTGKSSGGNGLSYIFAQYYNELFMEAIKAHRASLPQIPPFNLIGARNAAIYGEQWEVLTKLEVLIERVKASIKERYELELDDAEERRLIEDVLAPLIKAIDPQYPNTSQTNKDAIERFREHLLKAMVLPKKLTRGSYLNYWGKTIAKVGKIRVVEQIGRAAAKSSTSLHAIPTRIEKSLRRTERVAKLRQDIERYVHANVDYLLTQLKTMALNRENSQAGSKRKQINEIFDKNCTYVVIAGQGAQFKPIRQAIKNHFPRYNFPKENICQVEGKLAKEACCIGAVDFQASQNKPENARELHGVYGFLARSPFKLEDAFKAVNMSKIRSGGTETLTFPVKTTYRLIYSPNPSVSAESPPRIHDGFTALIDTFVDYKFTFEYIPHTPPIPPEIRVNGNAIDKIANFGDINESIYPKVWPEVVKAM